MTDEHFDAVVVGSGFGGSVSAYRMADAGLRVCVLERGKAYPPGSFPRNPGRFMANFWDPGRGSFGMFDVWSFRGLEAIVSAGLGGGSLIYANVLLRKPESWFVREEPGRPGYESWPVTRKDLDPHYDRAEAMLGATQYPFGVPEFASVPKVAAFREAAIRLGLDWQPVNLAVTFANAGRPPARGERIDGGHRNLHRMPRETCRLCGECDIGCNYGAKNTLDYNYLSAAAEAGAEIRALCEVRGIEPSDRGFVVRYVRHDPEDPKPAARLPTRRMTATRLVMAAGALGTPYLLLRNRAAFPRLGPALGTHFCGNGDLLAFVVRARQRRNGRVGPRIIDPAHGPVISSAAMVPDAAAGGGGRGFFVEDGGYPGFADWILEAQPHPSTVLRVLRFAWRRIAGRITGEPRSDIGGEIAAVLGPQESASALPLLGMGRDVADGRMRLRNGYLDVDWTIRTSEAYFRRVRSVMADLAWALGGRLRDSPLWRLRRVVTVHPLGGAPMAEHPSQGVVNPYGRVFGYPGLYVADGSVMPGPVGANPALTIAALADRFADRMAEDPRTGRWP